MTASPLSSVGRSTSPRSAPPCRSLGSQCRSLRVTLRIGELEEGPEPLDHEATWLLGHTAQIDFHELWEGEGDLYVEAVLHVPCRYLPQEGATARCRANGVQDLPFPPRSLPVLEATAGENPCATAPCQTADHTRKAACCRDLQLEIMCTRAQQRLEALVRSRRSPYLCKVERAGDYSLEVEMISACGYLQADGVSCSLHGRHRADGRTAKPDLCFEWPPKNRGLHPGCIFGPRRRSRPRA